MKITEEQQNIIGFDFKNTDTLLVNALAGTGKTFTLREFARKRANSSILYLAFNKAIAEEAKQKMPNNVKVSTCHSLAFMHVGKNYKEHLVNNLKPMHIYELFNNAINYDEAFQVNRMLNCFFQSNANTVEEYIDHNTDLEGDEGFSLSVKDMKRYTSTLFNKMKKKEMSIIHNFYLKLFQLEKIQLKYDYILFDEAQDANDVILDIVANQKNTRKVIVGDHYQQIYRWNGSVDALRKISKEKIMKSRPTTMYLTQSFRCSEKSIMYANQYLGLLRSKVKIKPAPEIAKNKGTAIISRTNAKLFDSVINNKPKSVHFLGGFDSYKFEDLVDILNLKLDKRESIKNKFYHRFNDYGELEHYATQSNDVEILSKMTIVDKYGTEVYKHYCYLKEIATDRKGAEIVATTAHKAKGQEFSKILITDDFFDIKKCLTILESKAAKDSKIEPFKLSKEEFNILYVTYTRSANEIISAMPYVSNEDIKLFHHYLNKNYIMFKN